MPALLLSSLASSASSSSYSSSSSTSFFVSSLQRTTCGVKAGWEDATKEYWRLESAATVAAATAKIRVAGVSKNGRHSQVVKSLQLVSRRTSSSLQVTAATAPSDGVRWWEKGGSPNLVDIHSTQQFIDALSNAGEKLVVVDFFATWCGSCRALYPKLQKLKDAIAQHNTARCSLGPPLGASNIDFSKPASSSKSDQPANATR
ncbi:hypothetical protein CY35_01G076400 [Sphagnum magellanicum]|nr:hypothetical protein CY35_01G076400 [Sphagnum magellanicum]